MKLMDLKKRDKVYTTISDGSTWFIFQHIDGLYSYCTTEKGHVVHPSWATPIIIEEGKYIIV